MFDFGSMERLYKDMVGRVCECSTRVQARAATGNKAALLAELVALLGQAGALKELLERELNGREL